MSGSEYRPGVCNIGRDERRKRRVAGAPANDEQTTLESGVERR